jgi:hypothetical protein
MARGTLGLVLVLLLGMAIGLSLVAIGATSLSVYNASPKLLVGCLAREVVWLNLPLTGAALSLLSVRSQSFVAPFAGAVIGAAASFFVARKLYPGISIIPPSGALPDLPVNLGLAIAFVVLTIAAAYASVWLDGRPQLAWLSYSIAAACGLCLSLLMTYSRRVLPPGGEFHLVVVPFIFGIILSGLVAGALVGRTFAVWAGMLVGQVGQLIAAEVMATSSSNLFPLVLVIVILSAGLAIPGAYMGEVIRRFILGSRVAATWGS